MKRLFLLASMFLVAGFSQLRAQTGNVGIGTSTPQARLHTVGSVRHDTLAGTGTRPVYATGSGVLSVGSGRVDSAQNNNPVAIPDGSCSGVTSTIVVTGHPQAVDPALIRVRINISHNYVSDMGIFLISPSGLVLPLSDRSGGAGQNFINTVFSDLGSQTLPPNSSLQPYTGTFRPSGTLSFQSCSIGNIIGSFAAFGSVVPNGTWTLKVVDVASPDGGMLNNWSISFDDGAAPLQSNYLVKQNSTGYLSSSMIYENGSVGIGTSSPSSMLQVAGNVHALSYTGNGAGLSNVVTTATAQTISGAKTFTSGKIRMAGSGDTVSSSGRMTLHADDDLSGGEPLTFAVGSEERARIDPLGRLGIGTSAPTQVLHLRSGLATTALVEGSGTTYNVGLGLKTPTNHYVLASIGSANETFGFSIYDAYQNLNRLVINNLGYIGIGVTGPTARLHTVGSVRFQSLTNGYLVADGNGNISVSPGGSEIQNQTSANQAAGFRITGNGLFNGGRIGVNRNAPAYQMDVYSGDTTYTRDMLRLSSESNAGTRFTMENTSASTAKWHMEVTGSQSSVGPGKLFFYSALTGYTPLSLDYSGSVGIGTAYPSRGRLHVTAPEYSVLTQTTFGSSIYFNSSSLLTLSSASSAFCGTGTNGPSIYAENSIVTNGNFHAVGAFYASSSMTFSDSRIKRELHASNGAEDLATLQQIKIIDYKMKDSLQFGNGTYKKVIAQQVEEIFPQAVNKSAGYLPNIYREANVESLASGAYRITWSGAYPLKGGEKLCLHGLGGRQILSDVLQVFSDSSVSVNLEKPLSEVFVYGTEVSDFRAVDYDAISMLNISATQELARKVAALETEVAPLKEQNRTLMPSVEHEEKAAKNFSTLAAQVRELQRLLGVDPKTQAVLTAGN